MKFLNSSKLKVFALFRPLWRHESDLALALTLTLTYGGHKTQNTCDKGNLIF